MSVFVGRGHRRRCSQQARQLHQLSDSHLDSGQERPRLQRRTAQSDPKRQGEGTTTGYTHVFIRSTVPSTIKNAAFRYMAPDFGSSDITGRYGIHFHMAGNGSRGSVVDGLVIRDTKGHAFVPHMSNGITFKNTIAYNVKGEAYWWDEGTYRTTSASTTRWWRS